MHGYSTDSGERRIVPLLLASVAIALACLSSKLLAVMHLSLPWWLDAPSTLGFYGALYALFDRKLWRNRLARKLGLVRVPNLTGRWRGYLLSSFDGHVEAPRSDDQYFPELDANRRLPHHRYLHLAQLRRRGSSRRPRRPFVDLPVSESAARQRHEDHAHALWHRHVASVR